VCLKFGQPRLNHGGRLSVSHQMKRERLIALSLRDLPH